MTTPTKQEIENKARELYFKDERDQYITPTSEELVESGYTHQAKCQLMRDQEKHEVMTYLEQMANEYGYELTKIKSEYCSELETFPIPIIMKEGCIIVGGRGCGKSNLGKLLVQQALACRIQVKVIDSSLAWKNYPLPKIKVRKGKIMCKPNAIYDLSRLSVIEMREFVTAMIAEDTMRAIKLTDLGVSVPLLYVLEEVQNLVFPNTLRMLKYQEVSRFTTQGRNFNLSYVGLTQRLSSVDTNLVEISGVKFWFKLEGENNLRKARAWLNKYETWNLRNLEIGQCYVQYNGKVKLVRLPLFDTQKVLA